MEGNQSSSRRVPIFSSQRFCLPRMNSVGSSKGAWILCRPAVAFEWLPPTFNSMSKRMPKVRELMRRELGTILTRDFAGVAKDSLVTVTDVDVTPDLRHAFVYVSIVGPANAPRVIEKLEARRPQIQKSLYERVVMKFSPRLEFRTDDSIERGNRIIDILSEVDSLPTAPPDEDGSAE